MTEPIPGNRKLEHIELALNEPKSSVVDAGWNGISLFPVALPLLDPKDINLKTHFLGHALRAPIMIAGMTGGHADTQSVNANLAIAADECGIALGVGSQRAALKDSSVASSYSIVRRHAPKAFICGNIGISQLVDGSIDERAIGRLIDMVEANAIAVHINLLQELIQPEGDIKFSNALGAIEKFINLCPVPVFAKETGCGLDRKTAERLKDVGILALDVGGAGGTSFVRIEGIRAERYGETRKARLANTFASWGVPAARSLGEVRSVGLPVIATGGIRNGLDAAKALAIGANLVGIGRQMLAAAMISEQHAIDELRAIIEELTIAMVLTESGSIESLQRNHEFLNKSYLDGDRHG